MSHIQTAKVTGGHLRKFSTTEVKATLSSPRRGSCSSDFCLCNSEARGSRLSTHTLPFVARMRYVHSSNLHMTETLNTIHTCVREVQSSCVGHMSPRGLKRARRKRRLFVPEKGIRPLLLFLCSQTKSHVLPTQSQLGSMTCTMNSRSSNTLLSSLSNNTPSTSSELIIQSPCPLLSYLLFHHLPP